MFDILAKKVITFFEEYIYPFCCYGCREEGSFLCDQCFEKITPLEVQICPYCLQQSQFGFTCRYCLESAPLLDGLFVFDTYEESSTLIRLLYSFKYEGFSQISEPLSRLLAHFFDTLKIPFIHQARTMKFIFCPVPLYPKRQKQRGYNQSILLSKYLPEINPFIKAHLLKRIRHTKAQVGLLRQQRLNNLESAFSIDSKEFQNALFPNHNSHILDATVILVDDIATTLATLEACAKTLKSNGIKNVYGLVLARKSSCSIFK